MQDEDLLFQKILFSIWVSLVGDLTFQFLAPNFFGAEKSTKNLQNCKGDIQLARGSF